MTTLEKALETALDRVEALAWDRAVTRAENAALRAENAHLRAELKLARLRQVALAGRLEDRA